jgi:hypothetical protein
LKQGKTYYVLKHSGFKQLSTQSQKYGILFIKQLVPKSWALELVTLCCYNSLHSFWEGFPLDVGTLLLGLASIQPQEH